MTVGLLLRLVRGASAAGWVRMGLTAVGLAVGAFAVLHVAMLSVAIGAREAAVEARSFSPTHGDGRAAFAAGERTEVWQGRRLTRVLLYADGEDAPAPPGVDAFPQPGQVALSPALAEAIGDDPQLARLVGGDPIGQVDLDGLVEPGEWLAYVGVGADERDALTPASGWGAPLRADDDGWRLGPVVATAITIIPGAAVFLVACTRLAQRTRRRRYAELRLLGMRRAAVARVAFLETALAGAVGTGIALVAFSATLPMVAGGGWFGMAWRPDGTPLSIPVIAAIWAATTLACGILGRAGLRTVLASPLAARRDEREAKTRWWMLVPLFVGVGGVGGVLTLRGDDPAVMTETMVMLTLGVVVLAALGVLLSVRHVVVATGNAVERFARSPLAQLVGRRLVVTPTSVSRLLTAVAALVLVSGIGASVLHANASTGPERPHLHALLSGGDLRDAEAAAAFAEAHGYPGWRNQQSIPEDPDWEPPPAEHGDGVVASRSTFEDILRSTGLEMTFMSCDELALHDPDASRQCEDGQQYLLHAESTPDEMLDAVAGRTFPFADSEGGTVPVAVPDERIVVTDGVIGLGVSHPRVLWTESTPPWGWQHITSWYFLLEPTPAAWETFRADVAEAFPAASPVGGFDDLVIAEMEAAYRQSLAAGTSVAAVLVVAALLIAVVDRSVQYRRDTTRLRLLGVRGRHVRWLVAAQVALPLLAVAAVAAAVAFLAGNAFVLISNLAEPWYLDGFGGLLWVLPATVALLAVTLYATTEPRLRAPDLRRE